MSQSEKLIKLVGIDDDVDQWLVCFEYQSSEHTWFEAHIPVPKSIDDERIVPYARHILHEVCRIARDATSDWKVNGDILQAWEHGGL